MELSCGCGNEGTFIEKTVAYFLVDAEGNRIGEIEDSTTFYCDNCQEPAEICEGD